MLSTEEILFIYLHSQNTFLHNCYSLNSEDSSTKSDVCETHQILEAD